jgi:predicted neutral ceramidase superfamily lipid hydrolase
VGDDAGAGVGRPTEDQAERVNRELIELLTELRVALPGVQVLFAFLLTVPFANGWTRTTDLQRDLYFVTLLLTALSTILLIAPSAYHRIRFRSHQKNQLIVYANRFMLAGLVFLALAMSVAITLVSDVLFRSAWAGVVGGVAALVFGLVWFALPGWQRIKEEDGRSRAR